MRSAAAPAARCRSTDRNRPSVRSRSAMVREEVDQERNRAARAALLCATQVGDTGYVEVRPAQTFGELGQETGRRDGTAFAAAGIGEVREIARSEEHTSELQSQSNLVCRLRPEI